MNSRELRRKHIKKQRVDEVSKQRKYITIILLSIVLSSLLSFASNAQDAESNQVLSGYNSEYNTGNINSNAVSSNIDRNSSDMKQDNSLDMSKLKYKSICVTHNDSLWSIATECVINTDYKIKDMVQMIKNINTLNTDAIKAGQYLIVPYI